MAKAKENPFNITFGEEPKSFIPRDKEIIQITDAFDSENPESKVFVLAGPRGCGKTVLLSKIKERYDVQDNWITVNLNPYGDMMEQLCAKIYERGKVKRLFLRAEFNFSFQGISFSIQGGNPVSDVNTLLEKMLSYLAKKKTRVLITVDDISNNNYVRYFAHAYQDFLREKFEVFLLMTGLYENISSLENDKGLTFLIRAPKIYLEKLSSHAIVYSYMKLLGVDQPTAINLAKLTMGYAYGFQLLGNLLYKNDSLMNEEIMERYDLTLEDNVYSLIWTGLSPMERNILAAIAEGNTAISDIIKRTGLTNSAIQVYKKRLDKAGLIDIPTRGQITLSLPRFKEYVLIQKELDA